MKIEAMKKIKIGDKVTLSEHENATKFTVLDKPNNTTLILKEKPGYSKQSIDICYVQKHIPVVLKSRPDYVFVPCEPEVTKCNSIIKFDDRLFAATDRGVYELDDDQVMRPLPMEHHVREIKELKAVLSIIASGTEDKVPPFRNMPPGAMSSLAKKALLK